LVPCCFLGVLPREDAQVPEDDLTPCSQIRDAFPFERSWLASTVLDPRSNLCYFNCSGISTQENKRAPPKGFNGWKFSFIFFTQCLFFKN
jgi:hypothetical protein